MNNILLIGGAGYVGSELATALLSKGYQVTIFDLFLFRPITSYKKTKGLKLIQGDIRNTKHLVEVCESYSKVIYLACISNDPSFDLNPDLGKSINYYAFKSFVENFSFKNCEQFIFASSSSVYGVSELARVTEDAPLKPLTDYSLYKLKCEDLIKKNIPSNTCWTILRPATVCGVSQRQRLDVVVNILTHHAVKNKSIRVFGGMQKRPNIHILDMVKGYCHLLEGDPEKINKKTFNIGKENLSVKKLAQKVAKICNVKNIIEEPTNDTRSYHICSDKFSTITGFEYLYTIEDAINDLQSFLSSTDDDFFSQTTFFNVQHLSKALKEEKLAPLI